MLAGRAQLYGLAAADEADVRHCIDILAQELRMTTHLCGARSIAEPNPRHDPQPTAMTAGRSRRLVSGLQPGEGALTDSGHLRAEAAELTMVIGRCTRCDVTEDHA